MYDTKTRTALVKARVRAARRRQARRGVYGLGAVCTALLAALTGMVGAAGDVQAATAGTFGTMLLHEAAGGYVLVGVASFTAAVVVTVLCIRCRRGRRGESGAKGKDETREKGEQV